MRGTKSGVEIFSADMALLDLSVQRTAEQDLLDFLGCDVMLPGELVDDLL